MLIEKKHNNLLFCNVQTFSKRGMDVLFKFNSCHNGITKSNTGINVHSMTIMVGPSDRITNAWIKAMWYLFKQFGSIIVSSIATVYYYDGIKKIVLHHLQEYITEYWLTFLNYSNLRCIMRTPCWPEKCQKNLVLVYNVLLLLARKNVWKT